MSASVPSYDQAHALLARTLQRAKSLSRRSVHPSEGWRDYWAAKYYVQLIRSTESVLRLAPPSDPDGTAWDFSAVGAVLRCAVETSLAIEHLVLDDVDDAIARDRINMIHLHDCLGRLKLFTALGEATGMPPYQAEDFSQQAQELRERLTTSRSFVRLPEELRKKILKGERAYSLTHHEIAERAGWSLPAFRALWQFLSTHAHALPMAVHRIGDEGRGTGVRNRVDENYTRNALHIARANLVGSTRRLRARRLLVRSGSWLYEGFVGADA